MIKKGSTTYNRLQALKKRLWNLYKTKEEVIEINDSASIFCRGVKFQRSTTTGGAVVYYVYDTSVDNYLEVNNALILEALFEIGMKMENYDDRQRKIKSGEAIYPIGLDRILESIGS